MRDCGPVLLFFLNREDELMAGHLVQVGIVLRIYVHVGLDFKAHTSASLRAYHICALCNDVLPLPKFASTSPIQTMRDS